ncbi:hypothetical protein LRY65_05560 [Candidatus Woesebacteria bacterium]|nr:hypothetical protein [Candidatus Woesebacteria bacterium]MCD8506728.1 hypothetical protein [Candidatus Woesebacteria bacterium]MCD8527636.1 hypothetical protein [Candidatus Woesebacteria bacterium]MCD8546393.1 hypothetical protein [Candidatus Woesebacteria bacterium]
MNEQTAQQLAAMDVFTLLGITDASEEDREAFLNQLQDAIWEEVVEQELADSLTDDEIDTIDRVITDEALQADEKRNQLFSLLANKVPNLEEGLADATNQLKYDLLGERVDGLREFYAAKPDQLQVLDQVEEMVNAGNVNEAVATLNKQQAENA